jgi:hypothetical protein
MTTSRRKAKERIEWARRMPADIAQVGDAGGLVVGGALLSLEGSTTFGRP